MDSNFTHRFLGEVLPHLGLAIVEWVGKHTDFLKTLVETDTKVTCSWDNVCLCLLDEYF